MLAIYKREVKSCFNSFIGFLFVGVTLFFPGLYYTVYCLMYGYPYYSYVVSSVTFLFMVSVPILTMRILAEERKNKTDQLILTAPVSVGAVVMGKFLALLTVFAVPTLITCTYPLILTSFGTVPLAECYIALLAFFLYGMVCIAIGVFVSSLTESQVISAVLTFALLFLGYMMSSITALISSTGNLFTKILNSFDLYTPYYNLLNGTLNLASVVYYLTITALFLFFTVQVIQKRRYSVSKKQFSFSAYSSVTIVVAVAVVVVINGILSELPVTWTSVDVTSEKLYSLTDQTKDFLDTLEDDVTIYAIIAESSADTMLDYTLQCYADSSSHITVQYVDPTTNPTFYRQYTSDSITQNSLIVVCGDVSKVIDYSDIYEYEYSIDYTTYEYYIEYTGYDGEGQITSALAYVTSDDLPVLYLTTGHGESELSTSLTTALTKENMTSETIYLMDYDEVPADAACLMIYAPTSDFNEDDAQKVIDYLEQGGNVLVVTGVTDEDMPNFDSILEYMGLSVVPGLVVETDTSYYYSSQLYLLPSVSSNTYTANVYGSYYLFAPYAQGITILDEEVEDIVYDTFMETSESAYSKTDLNASTLEKEDEDVDGPFAIGIEAVKTITVEAASDDAEETSEETSEETEETAEDATTDDESTDDTDDAEDSEDTDDTDEDEDSEETTTVDATMVVIGCQMFFTDTASQMVGGSNQMVFTSIVGSFATHEVSVSIPVKSYEVSYLTLTQSSIISIGLLVTVILPLGFLIAGFVVWLRRRKR